MSKQESNDKAFAALDRAGYFEDAGIDTTGGFIPPAKGNDARHAVACLLADLAILVGDYAEFTRLVKKARTIQLEILQEGE